VQIIDTFLNKIFALENGSTLTVDVENQTITIDKTGESEKFDINHYKKTCLLNGYDDIDYLINLKGEIARFENTMA
jgi:3-isopropylmalate/(R)-2-methylmalate dehydratase small subunit